MKQVYARRMLVIVAACGLAMQCIGRVRPATPHTLTGALSYVCLTMGGVLMTSTAISIAVFTFVRSRWSRGAVASIIGLALALVTGAGFVFCGIYWPWMLGYY